ncbi:hypothetical protein B0H13DRAFT_1888452 [Mycena leptocephala]|nr:hypothetical protein B0H13DRAFT_1888452 [Mycena leptocephala]
MSEKRKIGSLLNIPSHSTLIWGARKVGEKVKHEFMKVTLFLNVLEAQRVMAASMPSTAESCKYLQNSYPTTIQITPVSMVEAIPEAPFDVAGLSRSRLQAAISAL